MAGPARGRLLWLKVHKWIGLSFGFLFVFEAVTGCILVFQQEISDAFDAPYAAIGAPVGVGVDRAIALARAANGGDDLALIGLPASNADHAYRVLISGQDHGLSRPDDRVRYVGSATVTVNACTGTITGINDDRGDVSSRIFYWLRPLHSGEAFGIVGKIVVLILGLAFIAVGIAGIYLWWIRHGARKTSARSRPRPRLL